MGVGLFKHQVRVNGVAAHAYAWAVTQARYMRTG